MLGILLRGPVQLPDEQWNNELKPFNELLESPYDSWDIVEEVAKRLEVSASVHGDSVVLWLDEANHGTFSNTTGGIELAMKFLRNVAPWT